MDIQGVSTYNSQQTYHSFQSSYSPTEKTKVDELKNNDEEICIASTDKVDAEIAQLKAREAQLSKRLSSIANPEQQAALEDELSKIEHELRQKDNDTYRRQNTEFSSGIDIQA